MITSFIVHHLGRQTHNQFPGHLSATAVIRPLEANTFIERLIGLRLGRWWTTGSEEIIFAKTGAKSSVDQIGLWKPAHLRSIGRIMTLWKNVICGAVVIAMAVAGVAVCGIAGAQEQENGTGATPVYKQSRSSCWTAREGPPEPDDRGNQRGG